MSWRYTFDDGPERDLDCPFSEYMLAAMVAFSRENVQKMPMINVPSRRDDGKYDGHVLKIWDDKLLPEYGPSYYGIGYNQCVSLTITVLVPNA